MPKQVTVILPHVPIEFAQTLQIITPPHLMASAGKPIAKGIVDLELTFGVDGLDPKDEKDFTLDARAGMLMALIMFYESNPHFIERVLIHLITTDDQWRERADSVRETHPDAPHQRLASWFVHDLVILGGDLLGVDHRPCWEKGDCIHYQEEKHVSN